jgi:hypothetical protein
MIAYSMKSIFLFVWSLVVLEPLLAVVSIVAQESLLLLQLQFFCVISGFAGCQTFGKTFVDAFVFESENIDRKFSRIGRTVDQ